MLPRFALIDQGVIHFPESLLNHLLVTEEGLFLHGLGYLHLPGYAARSKNRHDGGHGVSPGLCRPGKEKIEIPARHAIGAREENGGKVKGLGHADPRICRDEVLFGLADIGALLDKA